MPARQPARPFGFAQGRQPALHAPRSRPKGAFFHPVILTRARRWPRWSRRTPSGMAIQLTSRTLRPRFLDRWFCCRKSCRSSLSTKQCRGPLRLCSGQAFDCVRLSAHFAQDDKFRDAPLGQRRACAQDDRVERPDWRNNKHSGWQLLPVCHDGRDQPRDGELFGFNVNAEAHLSQRR